jgi:hypothetical protein
MTTGIQVETKVHFTSGSKGRRRMLAGPIVPPVEKGRLPRITRMLALAHRFDRLLREGTVADQADLARLGHVSRARVTQIFNLLQLAPDIQETILFLPRIQNGREVINEHEVRPIATCLDWKQQRRQWARLVAAKLPVG